MASALVKLSRASVILGEKLALDEVSWEVRKGQSWVIIGPNGSGKTTLLSVINGYNWPSQGEVTVLGQQFGNVDLRELRKKVTFAIFAETDNLDQVTAMVDELFTLLEKADRI